MPLKSGIFNSVNGDRRYKAEDFARYFATFIANGVFPNPSTGFQVVEGGDMTVNLKAGQAWINGYYITNDADYNLTIEVADGVLNRVDRVVLQLNYLNREITPLVKKGTFASSPVAPALQRDADAYEIALADVYIGAGVLSVTQANITDTRLDSDLCGIVHGTVEQVDTTTIFNQYQSWYETFTTNKETEIDSWQTGQEQEFDTWQAQEQADFDAWFQTIQDTLSGDTAGNLQAQIGTLTNLQTTNKTDLVSAVNEVKGEVTEHQADYVKHPGFGVTVGTNNAYTVTLNPAPTAYVDGLGIAVAIHDDSTGAATLNVNGLGAKPLKKANGNDVTNLKANGVYTFRYNASTGNFILQGEGGSGNATASDLLSGKTASTDAGEITGTMINRGAVTITPSTSDQTIPSGYHNGSGVVKKAAIVNPGENILVSNSTLKSTTATTMTKLKATQINVYGIVRVKFDISSVNGYLGTLQIYVNGVPRGIVRTSTTSSYVTYTEDIAVEANDVVEIWGKGSSGANVNCNNFIIYYLAITGTNILQ